MSARTWIRNLFTRKPRTIRKEPFRFRPQLEALEDRTLLSVAVATNTSDLIGDIFAANNGTGPTTIELQAKDATNGFDFSSAYLSTTNALPQITASITIEGTSGFNNTIQRSTATGTPAFRLFDVAQGDSLKLENLTLTGGLVQGTGAAAEGGAIFSSGTLSLSGVTVQSNKAQGSNGTKGNKAGAVGGNGASALGGGLYVAGGSVSLTNDTLRSNIATGGNGGNGGSAQFSHPGSGGSGGSGGSASGGGMYVAAGTVTLSNDTLSSNNAKGGNGGTGGQGAFGNGGSGGAGGMGLGGGLYMAGGTVTLSNATTLSSNKATGGNGGAGGLVVNNDKSGSGKPGSGGVGGAGSGGGMYVNQGGLTLTGDTLNDNSATGGNGGAGGVGSGGSVYLAGGMALLSHDFFSGNSATGGKGGSGANVLGSTGETILATGGAGGNGGAGEGGSVDVAQGIVALSNDTLSDNSATGGNAGNAGTGNLNHGFNSSGIGGNAGAGSGGGLYIATGIVTLSTDPLSGNKATGGKGFAAHTHFADSVAKPAGPGGAGMGGGLYVAGGNVTLTNDTLSTNKATGGQGGRGGSGVNVGGNSGGQGGSGGAGMGGGMYVAGGTVTLTNDTFSTNKAIGGTGANGALGGNGGSGGSAGAGSGGGMYVAGGTVTLTNDTFSSNQATGGTGGHGANGTLILGLGGSGDSGGAASGGGLYVAEGAVTLNDDTLSGNKAIGGIGGSGGQAGDGAGGSGGSGGTASGGGVYVTQGTVTLNNDTLSGNKATGGIGGHGDGSNNDKFNNGSGGIGGDALGGGLYMATGSVTMTNDTLSGNNVQGGDGGHGGTAIGMGGDGGNGGNAMAGGLYILTPLLPFGRSDTGGGNATAGGLAPLSSSHTITLANTLIAENTFTADKGGTGGGGSGNGATGTAGKTSDPDVSGTVTFSDDDLIGDPGDSSGFSKSNGDILNPTTVGLDPMGLQKNGGPTKTIALISGSQAIDAGDSSVPGLAVTDQRGYARIVGQAVDIGAYEFGATDATADLSVSGNAPSSVSPGGQITYTLTVATSSGTQSNVILADVLPANTTLVSWTVPSGWSQNAPAAGSSSGTVKAWNSSLDAGSPATFTLVVQVNSGTPIGTVISNSASVGPLTDDPNPGNNSVTLSTKLQFTPTISISDGGTYNGMPYKASAKALGTDGQTQVIGTFSFNYYLGSGTSGTNLGATPPTDANTYTVVAQFTSGDTDYSNNTGQFTFTIIPAHLSVTPTNFNATAGALFSGTVATITNNVDPLNGADYTALISWGDGTTSSGTISGSGSTLTVTGSHTFADPVNEMVSVTISNNKGNTTTVTVNDNATVTSLNQNVIRGLTGSIVFWLSKSGQTLIDSFNGGSTSTALANWLAATFPNLYGADAGANNLTGDSNAEVAAYFQTLFELSDTLLPAQVLATALNVYATTSSLGGNAGAAHGFNVSAAGLGAYSYNVGSDGAAFGVANKSTRNVYELLVAVNSEAVTGVLYNGNTMLQSEAADLLNKLTQAGAIASLNL